MIGFLLMNFLYGIAGAAIVTRRDAHDLLEPSSKTALIVKTGFESDVDDRKTLGEEAPGRTDPPLNQVCLRGETCSGPEHAQKVKYIQIRDIREFGNRDILQKMGSRYSSDLLKRRLPSFLGNGFSLPVSACRRIGCSKTDTQCDSLSSVISEDSSILKKWRRLAARGASRITVEGKCGVPPPCVDTAFATFSISPAAESKMVFCYFCHTGVDRVLATRILKICHYSAAVVNRHDMPVRNSLGPLKGWHALD